MIFETENTLYCFLWSQIMTVINYMVKITYKVDYVSTCQESYPCYVN
jgi:hypothetical protein